MSIPLSRQITEILNSQLNNASNLYLLLTKYVNCWINRNNTWKYEQERRNGGSGKTKCFLAAVRFSQDQQRTSFYKTYFERWECFLSSQNATQLRAKVHWRLVVGLGSGSVLETSMTLHHIYGVPYIPGSALKGVVSCYYLEKNKDQIIKKIDEKNRTINEENKKYKKDSLSNLEEFAKKEYQEYIEIFGNEEKKGKVIFFDAYPTTFPQLEIDIMNPHFDDYYKGEKPPADYLIPKPIKFLTVAKDTEFIFAFKTESNDKTLTETVKTLITEALKNYGIGAKTAVGYGYFKDFIF